MPCSFVFKSNAVLEAFKAERTYLYVSTKAKKPEIQPPELMTGLHTASDAINNLRESNRASPLIDHLSAVAEGIVALGWFFDPKPADFVSEMLGGIQYYGNKVLKEYKEKYAFCTGGHVAPWFTDRLAGIVPIMTTSKRTTKSSNLFHPTFASITQRA
jgi:hypothetical protein